MVGSNRQFIEKVETNNVTKHVKLLPLQTYDMQFWIVGVKRTVCSAGCYVVREKEARDHSALCMAKKRKEEQYIKFVYLTAVFFITYALIASPASQIF